MTVPSPASRVRSALAAAGSLDVAWDEGALSLDGAPSVDADGALVLPDLAGTVLAGRLASGRDGGRLAVVVTVTDVAPLAVRERVRGRVALAGTLDPDGRLTPELVRWQPAVRPDGRARPAVAVDLAAYRAARPDPLAADEADLLLALAAAPGLVAGLAGHLPACVVVDPERPPVPVRLDRDGVVLRVAGPGRSVDARLSFGVDAVTPVLVWAALEELGTRV